MPARATRTQSSDHAPPHPQPPIQSTCISRTRPCAHPTNHFSTIRGFFFRFSAQLQTPPKSASCARRKKVPSTNSRPADTGSRDSATAVKGYARLGPRPVPRIFFNTEAVSGGACEARAATKAGRRNGSAKQIVDRVQADARLSTPALTTVDKQNLIARLALFSVSTWTTACRRSDSFERHVFDLLLAYLPGESEAR